LSYSSAVVFFSSSWCPLAGHRHSLAHRLRRFAGRAPDPPGDAYLITADSSGPATN